MKRETSPLAALTVVGVVGVVFAALAGTAFASFAGDGIETVDFGAVDGANGVAVGPDREIVTVGSTSNAATIFDLAVARFTADGTPDAGFSTDGRQITDLGAFDSGRDITVQRNGRIVAVGSNGTDDGQMVVVRYTKGGELDPSFSGDGIREISFPGGSNGEGLTLGRSGTIVAVGETGNDFAVAKLRKNGKPDRSFSKDGKAVTNMGGSDRANDVVIQPDGGIVVGGTACIGGGMCVKDRMAVARYRPDGSLDRSFAKDGRIRIKIRRASSVQALALQRDGKIVLAGSANADFNSFAAARLKPNGSLDRRFGRKGKTVVSFSDSGSASDMAILRSGRIVMAGDTLSNTTVDVALVALRPNGSLDRKFVGDGKTTLDVGAGNGDSASGIAVLSRRTFVVAGTFSPDNDVFVARFKNDGTLAD